MKTTRDFVEDVREQDGTRKKEPQLRTVEKRGDREGGPVEACRRGRLDP